MSGHEVKGARICFRQFEPVDLRRPSIASDVSHSRPASEMVWILQLVFRLLAALTDNNQGEYWTSRSRHQQRRFRNWLNFCFACSRSNGSLTPVRAGSTSSAGRPAMFPSKAKRIRRTQKKLPAYRAAFEKGWKAAQEFNGTRFARCSSVS